MVLGAPADVMAVGGTGDVELEEDRRVEALIEVEEERRVEVDIVVEVGSS